MTSASESQAEKFLKRTKWNFQEAINLFFDEGTVAEKKEVKHSK